MNYAIIILLQTVQEKPQLVGPQYRKTFSEIEMEKQKKHARKKEEKQKAKEEAKMLAVWNIDNQIVRELTLDIKFVYISTLLF